MDASQNPTIDTSAVIGTASSARHPASRAALRHRDRVVRWTLVNGPGDRRDFGDLPAEVAALS